MTPPAPPPAASEAVEAAAPSGLAPEPVLLAAPSLHEQLEQLEVLSRRGGNAQAEPQLTRLVRQPLSTADMTRALVLLGAAHVELQRYQEAAADYERATEVGRGRALGQNAIVQLARVQRLQLHDPEAARASYRRYLEEVPNGPLAGQARQALCRLGDRDQCDASP